MVIRICVCTHSSIQHQRLPYGEQPCHSNITGPYPSPRMLLPQLGASWQLCPCLLHPGTAPGRCWDLAVLPLHCLGSQRREAGAGLPEPHTVPSAAISCDTAGLIHSPAPAPCHWQSQQ